MNLTALAQAWKTCEAEGSLPPGVKSPWDDCSPETQALIIAYHMIGEGL